MTDSSSGRASLIVKPIILQALNFYKKVGFEIFKEEDIPYYQYWMNDFILRKHLN